MWFCIVGIATCNSVYLDLNTRPHAEYRSFWCDVSVACKSKVPGSTLGQDGFFQLVFLLFISYEFFSTGFLKTNKNVKIVFSTIFQM